MINLLTLLTSSWYAPDFFAKHESTKWPYRSPKHRRYHFVTCHLDIAPEMNDKIMPVLHFSHSIIAITAAHSLVTVFFVENKESNAIHSRCTPFNHSESTSCHRNYQYHVLYTCHLIFITTTSPPDMNRSRAGVFNIDMNLNDILSINEEISAKLTGSEQIQPSWKCEPVSLTEEELREGVNFEGPCLIRANNVFQNK